MREINTHNAWSTREIIDYLGNAGIGIVVGKDGPKLVKPPHVAEWAYQKFVKAVLPHLKVRRENVLAHYERLAEAALPAAERRAKLFTFHKDRIASYRADFGVWSDFAIVWFSAYTRAVGTVNEEKDKGYPIDATTAEIRGTDRRSGNTAAALVRNLPGSTFPAVWRGTKPGIWHVPHHVALQLPEGCIPPADYRPPKFVAADRRKEQRLRWMRLRYGKDETKWKDHEKNLPD